MHCLINNLCRDIPLIPMVKISPSKAGGAFLILVRELRSHLPQGKKKKKNIKKRSNIVANSIKTLKTVHKKNV